MKQREIYCCELLIHVSNVNEEGCSCPELIKLCQKILIRHILYSLVASSYSHTL